MSQFILVQKSTPVQFSQVEKFYKFSIFKTSHVKQQHILVVIEELGNVPGIRDTHPAVNLVAGLVIEDHQQQIVDVGEKIQRDYHCEEHSNPGSLKETTVYTD